MASEMLHEQSPSDERRVLNAAMEAGHILLQNGAEISRVEETMERKVLHPTSPNLSASGASPIP